MRRQHLHIYRNTPAGRETLLASKLMAQRLGVPLVIWIPSHPQLALAYGVHELLVSLDGSYLRSRETAERNIAAILDEGGPFSFHLVEPTHFREQGLPELPTDFMSMTCPRAISDRSERVSLGSFGPGHIGPGVRALVKHAEHPVLVPGAVFSRWERIAVLYGGSALGVLSVRLGLDLARRCGAPLTLYTFAPRDPSTELLEGALATAGLLDAVRDEGRWEIWRTGAFEDHLLDVPRDALIVVGAAGHGAMHEIFSTTNLKKVQEEWPGPVLVHGPRCTA